MNETLNINSEKFWEKLKETVIKTQSPWFTIKEACAYTKYGDTKIRNAIKVGKLKAHREDGGDYRIHQRDLDCYIMFGKKNVVGYEEDQLRKRNRYSKIES